MARIKQYDLLEEFGGDEVFVVETDEGTKSLTVDAFKEFITEKIEEKAAQLNQSEVVVASDTDSEYILSISIGADTITTPNLKGKSISSISVVNHHLMIYFNDETSFDCGVIDGEVPKYGVCRDVPSQSPTLTRVGDAAGLIAQVYKGDDDEDVRNDFDFIYPWSEMKKCTLANNGTVNHYSDDPDYKEDGTDGQVMVEIPKFYIAHYFDESEAKEFWYISKEKINSRYRLPKPFIAADGTELDKIYIAAFPSTEDLDEMLDSKSGGNAYAGKFAYSWAIDYAKARGTNWHQLDIAEYSDVLVPLFIIEFATLDSQSVFYGNTENYYETDTVYLSLSQAQGGSGAETATGNSFYTDGEKEYFEGQEISIVGIPEADATGNLDVKDGEDSIAVRVITAVETAATVDDVVYQKITFEGDAVELTNEGEFAVSVGRNGVTNYIIDDYGYSSGSLRTPEGTGIDFVYRGMQNLWGEYTWLAGVLNASGKYYVTDKLSAYGTSITDDYAQLSYNTMSSNGYLTKLGLDEDRPWATLPTEGGGASDKAFCDNVTANANATVKSVRFGGGTALACGLFGFACNNPATNTTALTRRFARLSYRSYS